MCDACTLERQHIGSGHRRWIRYLGVLRRFGAPTKDLTSAALDVEWQMIDAIKQNEELPFIRALERLFARERAEVMMNLRDAAPQILPTKQPFSIGVLLDVNLWQEQTRQVIAGNVLRIMETGFGTGFDRIGIEATDFTSRHPDVRFTLSQVLHNSRTIQHTLADRLAETIQEGLSEGDDMEELVTRVDEQMWGDYQSWKPRQIAQTASTAGFEAGQQRAYDEAGVEGKAWLSQRDGRVRESHRLVDGQRVRLDEPFVVRGVAMRFPGDPQAPPELTVNCRCSTRPLLNV